MNQPARPRTAVESIEAFLDWMGPARLAAVTAPLMAAGAPALRQHYRRQRHWIACDLEAFERAREAHAVTEARVLAQWAPLARLASAVQAFDSVGATPVPGRYRDLLLGDEGANYAWELIAAAHHDRRGYTVGWLPEDSGEGEFTITAAPEPVAHIECKRIGADAIEWLRMEQAAQVADEIDHALARVDLSGAIMLSVGHALIDRPALVDAVRALVGDLQPGEIQRQAGDLRLSGSLSAGDAVWPYAELVTLAQAPTQAHRVISGLRRDEVVLRPRVIDVEGPKRSLAWFSQKG